MTSTDGGQEPGERKWPVKKDPGEIRHMPLVTPAPRIDRPKPTPKPPPKTKPKKDG